MFYNYWQVSFMSKVQEKIADSKLSNWSKIFVMFLFLDFPLKLRHNSTHENSLVDNLS